MTTLRWASVPEDVAPGDPAAIAQLALRLHDTADDAASARGTLDRLATSVDAGVWRGEAAHTFVAELGKLPPELQQLGDSYRRAAEALSHHRRVLAGLQEEADAVLAEIEAAGADEAAQLRARDQAELSGSVQLLDPFDDAITAAQTRSRRAEALLEELQARHRRAEDELIAELSEAGELGIANDSWFERARDAVGDWVDDNAGALRSVAGALGVVAGIAGALSFIPVLTPIFLPVALVAGGAATAIDATLVATGNGDWRGLAIDGLLMAVPGSRLFSAAARGARGAAGPARAAARALRARAAAVEPGVTRALKAVASEHGGTMVGLRYRLKSQASLERKIVIRMSTRGETPEVAGDRIKDALRYTMTFSDEELALQARRSLDRLTEEGYDATLIKNYWVEGNPYKGINAEMRAPDGEPFELQVHTPASFEMKMRTHADYEIARNEDLPLEVRRAAHHRMAAESSRLEHPPGIDDLGSPVTIELPR